MIAVAAPAPLVLLPEEEMGQAPRQVEPGREPAGIYQCIMYQLF